MNNEEEKKKETRQQVKLLLEFMELNNMHPEVFFSHSLALLVQYFYSVGHSMEQYQAFLRFAADRASEVWVDLSKISPFTGEKNAKPRT